MAKFFGEIGFEILNESVPGVHQPTIVPREYYGDMERLGNRWESDNNTTNDNMIVKNYVSVVADDFIEKNLGCMRWVSLNGTKWKIQSVEIAYPRVKLTLGGVWNGE